MKQTAIDWLFEEMKCMDIIIPKENSEKLLEVMFKAKEMEKAQKAKEYIRGYNDAKQIDILLNELNK